ncbi:hypothetical protein Rhopal_004729-T1 [Rhodotorula paludigena]|uniref:GATA-type domain-containing protein n=1 Tax=Rhodotorula paludigena TaxID=86838 RepID=A0AAV5GQA2_9BASI|nr:hypothetical protein Rhopal_004729-T1 [Rhodotorula paludigena]
MSYALPKVSATEIARREMQNAVASTSLAPTPPTGAFALASGGPGSEARRAGAAKAGTRRKGKGKGRMMMLKIFYSLSSPRFAPCTTTSPAHNPILPASTPTPDFLAVLDPALAPSPNPPAPETPSSGSSGSGVNYSCMARLSAPVWVQVVGARRGDAGDDKTQFGKVTLKTCLSAICISRPELVIDPSKDFSVAAFDPYESSHQRQAPGGTFASSNSSSRPGEGLVEGKGMLSWTLAEKKEGTTVVCGKIVGPEGGDARRVKRRRGDDGGIVGGADDDDDDSDSDEPEETLEVWLQLTERDAFTQGQFLDCLRSYHNPVSQLQNEISDFHSSPPKRRDSAVFPPASSAAPAARPAPAATGDPVKRKRPREQSSLPIPPLPSSSAAPPAPFATGQPASSPAPFSAPLPAVPPAVDHADLQDPQTSALLHQLLSSLTSGQSNSAAAAAAAPLLAASSMSLDSPDLLPALQTLAKYYGMQLPGATAAPAAPPPFPSSSAAATLPLFASAPPPGSGTAAPAPLPAAASASAPPRRKTAKDREHFAAIDPNTLPVPQVGKQNPRDPNGCTNCKRKKSTTWREGTGPDGKMTSVCNACGTFYNKNGYHRSKTGPNNAPPSGTSPPHSGAFALASASAPKSGRPLQGRLTATCEADLKRKAKKPKSGSQPGVIPPLSPSKQVGPRSPSLSFSFGAHRSGGRSHGVTMSSPGRSPRMKYRQTANPFAATSPLRGSTSGAADGKAGDGYGSDGERGSNSLTFGSLFGLNGSPSPVRIDRRQRTSSAGKPMPSYLLTASPGTALDRILNDTNIGSISAFGQNGSAAPTEGMQLEHGAHDAANSGLPDDFSFFLQPGSPTLNKENARPRSAAATSTDGPQTDLGSFESVLSSLRRDFDARLSSNALTAPSSPAPSSPCVLPRTSTATPGSKGKAPQSCGRPPPSILDSFIDDLVPAFALDANSTAAAPTGITPASDSDGWSPTDPQQDQDQTLTLDSFAGATRAPGQSVRPPRGEAPHASTSGLNFSHLASNKNPSRRAAFIPSHLLAPSDATDFDLGSLPPSSPPQLPSEAFPTPSDFDGITPSADGGDTDERTGGPMTIEAVAQQVAREPDADARKGMIALLQSLSGGNGGNEQVQLPGPAGDKIQLDRETVNKLLSLISANSARSGPSTAAPEDDISPTPASSTKATPAVETVEPAAGKQQADTPDFSGFDFKALEASQSETSSMAQSFGQGGQLSELYQDLFANHPF